MQLQESVVCDASCGDVVIVTPIGAEHGANRQKRRRRRLVVHWSQIILRIYQVGSIVIFPNSADQHEARRESTVLSTICFTNIYKQITTNHAPRALPNLCLAWAVDSPPLATRTPGRRRLRGPLSLAGYYLGRLRLAEPARRRGLHCDPPSLPPALLRPPACTTIPPPPPGLTTGTPPSTARPHDDPRRGRRRRPL